MTCAPSADAGIAKMALALGERMHCAGIVLKGTVPDEKWLELLPAVARAIGMAPVGEAANCSGMLLLSAAGSFLALSPSSAERGAFLFVCSAKPYFTADIDATARDFGLKAELSDSRRFYRELNLT